MNFTSHHIGGRTYPRRRSHGSILQLAIMQRMYLVIIEGNPPSSVHLEFPAETRPQITAWSPSRHMRGPPESPWQVLPLMFLAHKWIEDTCKWITTKFWQQLHHMGSWLIYTFTLNFCHTSLHSSLAIKFTVASFKLLVPIALVHQS